MFLASDPLFAAIYPVSQDSYVDARHPYAKSGGQKRIKATAWAPHTGFGQFDLSAMTNQQTVSKAMLRLHVSELRSAGRVGIYLVRDSWIETNINARNQPRIDTQPIASLTLKSGDVGNTVEVDVTAAVQAWQAGRANYGLGQCAQYPCGLAQSVT